MIRKAQAGDVTSFVALQRRVEEAGEIRGYTADSEHAWSERDLTWSFVAASDAHPVGFIYCAPRAYAGESVFAPESRILEIHELVVHSAHRDRGHGRQLVEAVREQARSDGFSHLRVYSASWRFDDVLRFYRACGFAPWYLELTQSLES